MKRIALAVTCLVSIASVAPVPVAADEIDDLAERLNLRGRFHGYKPKFHYTQKTFTFPGAKGAVKRTWRIIMDRDKYVALVPDDHIQLLAFTPGTARKYLVLPRGRYHLDTMLGPPLPTQFFLPRPVTYRPDGSSNVARTDHFRLGGSKVTLVRYAAGRHGADVVKKYVVRVHEQFGYMVEATTTVKFRPVIKTPPGRRTRARAKPKDREFRTEVACPNTYIAWPTRWIYDRTVFSPGGGAAGYVGYANNPLAMARTNRTSPTWRDNGFIAFLHAKGGWSPCRTRSDGGPDANMIIDPNTNTLHVTVPFAEELPRTDANQPVYKCVERMFAVPPELGAHLREKMRLLHTGAEGIVLRVGVKEDFENQPVALTEPVRGLAWTSRPPKLTGRSAHSGEKSLVIDGQAQVNVPYFVVRPDVPRVSLRPETKYRLEAYIKVKNLEPDERVGYRQAYEKLVAKIRQEYEDRDKEPPIPALNPLKPHGEAYITAHLYESKAAGRTSRRRRRRWAVRQQTTAASGSKGTWQQVSLEFTTPKWDPYVHIEFVCHSGTALMDDFSLTKVP